MSADGLMAVFIGGPKDGRGANISSPPPNDLRVPIMEPVNMTWRLTDEPIDPDPFMATALYRFQRFPAPSETNVRLYFYVGMR